MGLSKALQAFRDQGLETSDLITFTGALNVLQTTLGSSQCWDLKAINHAFFQSFVLNEHSRRVLYRGREARFLTMAVTNRFKPVETEEQPYIVRTSICTAKFCINPNHYYWGSRHDMALERTFRKYPHLTPERINELKRLRRSGLTYGQLASTFEISPLVARSLCKTDEHPKSLTINQLDLGLDSIVQLDQVTTPINYNEVTCYWGHKGKFGAQGECLECMERIRQGFCTLDLTQFSFEDYWLAKAFWERVDIGESDKCWNWNGSMIKQNTETCAYMPSPFHVTKNHSASRVSFWLTRGYTGKLRIYKEKTCTNTCCNPLHLRLKDIDSLVKPTGFKTIQLSHAPVWKSSDSKTAVQEQ